MAWEGELKTGDLVRCDPVFNHDWNGKFELYEADEEGHYAQFKAYANLGIILAVHPFKTKHHGMAEAVYVMAQCGSRTLFGWTPGLYLERVASAEA